LLNSTKEKNSRNNSVQAENFKSLAFSALSLCYVLINKLLSLATFGKSTDFCCCPAKEQKLK
jgi:hypothetical protein